MYDPDRDNRYTEDWINFLIWFDRDGFLTEAQKKVRLNSWYGNQRYTFINSHKARALGHNPRT